MLLLFTVWAVGWPGYTQAPTPTEVRVVPPTSQVVAGGEVQVAVEVVDASELYAFDLAVLFDPDVVEVVDADPSQDGIQVAQGPFLDAGSVEVNAADNVGGTVQFAMTQVDPSPPKSGTGALLLITWRGIKAGASTAITLDKARLARRDGSELTISLTPGEIVVRASAASPTPLPSLPPPTATPAATATPPTAEATPTPGWTLPPSPTTPPAATAMPTPGWTPTPSPTTPPAATTPSPPPATASAPSPTLPPSTLPPTSSPWPAATSTPPPLTRTPTPLPPATVTPPPGPATPTPSPLLGPATALPIATPETTVPPANSAAPASIALLLWAALALLGLCFPFALLAAVVATIVAEAQRRLNRR